MGIFKLPKNLVQELSKLVRNYWWGQQNQESKINWMSWKQMKKGKSSGGLGFRDFSNFNLALLAKQGWKIVSNPCSLAAQVLKEKYFPGGSFLTAKKGHNSSFTWQSFLAARPLLREGMVSRIGNGKSTEIWKDKWLPIPTTFKPQDSVRFMHETTKVSMLIDELTS